MSKFWEPCPRCGSNKVKTLGKGTFFLIFFGSGGCLIWIGFIFFPVLILAAILILVSPLAFLLPKVNQCEECKYSWKVNKKGTENIPTTPTQSTPVPTTLVTPQPPDILPVPERKTVGFNVSGVTFDNDKGKDIQNLLRKLGKEISRDEGIRVFSGLKNSEILEYNEEVSEFEDLELGEYIRFEKDPENEFDKNAIKVLVEYPLGTKHHIGYVPKTDNVNILKLIDSDSIKSTSALMVGGKIKLVDYDEEKDKDIVVVDEITLGVKVTLHLKD